MAHVESDRRHAPARKLVNYEVGQDNVRPFGLDVHNPVFFVSGLSIIALVLFALIFREQSDAFFSWLRPALTTNFAWLFMLTANVFVLFCLALIVLPVGRVRIGGRDAVPEFSYPAWFSMLFAAGMGIGLMFYGVSEPISHYTSAVGPLVSENGVRTDWAPLGGAEGDALAARRLAMAATIFHWGLHPWAIYAVVGLALAFFTYNRGLPLTIRSAFHPIFGDRVWGPIGHVIDTLAVFATLFGLATSLGYGAEQAAAGLNFLFGIPSGTTTNVVLIIVITGIALVSVVAGLDKGVKILSEINMVLAAALLLFVIVAGPTLMILTGFGANLLAYLRELPALSNWIGRSDHNFLTGWTTFYWAWWISWAPFVGMFIARVSRGRTVREFIICVLLIPSTVCVLWMTAFGGTAITQVADQGLTAVADAELPLKLFVMLQGLPLTFISSMVGIVLVIVFFVTSSDSGSLVIDTITAGGKVDAPVAQRVFWACLEGLVAIALLLGGGLASLQAAAIATGFPFAIVLLGMCVATYMGLRQEHAMDGTVLEGRDAITG